MDTFQEGGGWTKSLVWKMIEPRSDQVVKYFSFVIVTLLTSDKADYIFSLSQPSTAQSRVTILLDAFLLSPGIRLSCRSWVSILGFDYSWSLDFLSWLDGECDQKVTATTRLTTGCPRSGCCEGLGPPGEEVPNKSYSIFL